MRIVIMYITCIAQLLLMIIAIVFISSYPQSVKCSVQFSCSVMSDSLQPHGLQHARPPSPSPTPRIYSNSCPLSQWCHPTISSLSSPSPPTFNLSQHQGLFQWVSSSHQVAKVWSFSFNISPSNEHPGLISFRVDWFDILAVQGTLKSLLQHTSKASILNLCIPKPHPSKSGNMRDGLKKCF